MEPWLARETSGREPNGAAGEDSTALRSMLGRQEGLNGGRVLIIDLFHPSCWDDRFSPKIHKLSIHMSMIVGCLSPSRPGASMTGNSRQLVACTVLKSSDMNSIL